MDHGEDVDKAMEQLSALLALCGLEDGHVTHCFLGGSRLWGSHKPTSDWDLRVVVDVEPEASSQLRILEHRGEQSQGFVCFVLIVRFKVGPYLFNVTVYGSKEFEQRLCEHEINAIMCILAPSRWVGARCVATCSVNTKCHLRCRWRDRRSFTWKFDAPMLRSAIFR